ncbi:OVARIAN CARCINOMA ANTIGEN CA125-RELATED [Salix viminalis]|uniref:OVARIAN CARCINOMA ANTIGEN CA125-RELATED n=1 Tax=Salix viminalis TaxID=40686 RepID=A0A9Q0NMA1_SALVM|nr:OVARIAN CARCINOMA ANTIGEN CA125-RELATED [Salix viminalis]
MDSTMVIKVKYGDTLRRFNAHVKENEQLDLDMTALRAKIFGLFYFPADSDLTLTYIDEDGDVVTLADDDDLCDVMRQNLKFLRIDVQLNNDKFGKSYARSSGSCTPMRSPRIQSSIPCLNNGVADVLKSVPEPLQDILSKISLDLASKAVASSAVLTELVDCISKIGQSHLNPAPQSQDVAGSSAQTGAPVPTVGDASKDMGMLEELSNSNSPFKTGLKESFENVTRTSVAPHTTASAPVNLNWNPQDSYLFAHCAPFASSVPAGDDGKEAKKQNTCLPTRKPAPFGLPPIPMNYDFPSHTDFPSAVRSPKNHAIKRSNCVYNPIFDMFHGGVQCDGCGVHPINGPRYKSKVKEDYDLCSICFAAMGNEADFIKMDRPVSSRNPWSSKSFIDPPQKPWAFQQPLYKGSCGVKGPRPKLDSRFVLDVNVSDGTVIPSSTPFTKIWRMRNSGSVAWPQGARLVWIGGDRCFSVDSVEIEIPVYGVPIDGELDIAANFVSPALPGRYISYWRMACPSGVKFGQRVWVLIEVNSSLKDPFFKDLNLNESPNWSGSKFPEDLDMNAQPADGSFPRPQITTSLSEPIEPMFDEQPKSQELNFPIDDALLVGHGVLASAPPQTSASSAPVLYPMIDIPETAADGSFDPLPSVDAPASSEGVNTENDVEKTLLKELEEMGFKQVDLNKEILRRNEYDLEQSVDDLCGVAEWDPILEELEEMGFCDKEMNKKLLKKNNGSIKGVVMDILTGGRD